MKAAGPTARIHLYLLGSFRLEHNARRIHLPRRKVESLLAYLALNPQDHPREKLAAIFWGDSSDAKARHSLRTAVATIRQHLHYESLVADRDSVQLNPDFALWVDAREFARLSDSKSPVNNLLPAVDLYCGDLLADFYDDWILSEREHYRNLYLGALLRLTQELRSQSEYERAIELAQKALASDAVNERACQHLMFCYMMVGKKDAALKEFERCARVLVDELGAEPTQETIALYHWIRQSAESKSLGPRITNLPIPLSSFIGRKREMVEVKRLLSTTRLLTLTGAGGSGKTRLAIQVAIDLIDSFKDGVWWVELASTSNQALVPHAISKALGVHEAQGELLSETLANFLNGKTLLLVLDNCEHLIAACAQITSSLLRESANLKILTTSRESLGIIGEVIWRVPTLALPDPQHLSMIELLMEYEGIRLFVDRATAAKPDFALTPQNAPSVTQICQRLDGIPLAIELAAARTRVLSVENIAERFNNRFNLLTTGSRTALPRQQTLRATIDWSYDLLPEDARFLFRRLSVFGGGFSLNAVEKVCCDSPLTPSGGFDLLARLVDRSLVIVEQRQDAERYRMLETIREYAHEKLHHLGEANLLQGRHLDFFLKLAETIEPELYSAEQFEGLNRLENNVDNMRAALTWALANGREESGLRLAGALFWLWNRRSYWSEGRHLLERTLASTSSLTSIPAHAKALFASGALAWLQGDHHTGVIRLAESVLLWREFNSAGGEGIAYALAYLGLAYNTEDQLDSALAAGEESVALFRKLNDKWGLALSLDFLGIVIRDHGDYKTASSLFDESLIIFRELGDKWGISFPLNAYSQLALLRGDYATARTFVEEALALRREMGDRGMIAVSLGNLGQVVLALGDHAQAYRLFQEKLALDYHMGSKRGTYASLVGLARACAATGQHQKAARLFGAVQAIGEKLGDDIDPREHHDQMQDVAIVQAALGNEQFTAVWAEGRAMKFEQAVEFALKSE